MIVVASENGGVGIDTAWAILAGGGSALDAVEAGTRAVEDNPDDHTVGFGGYPNLLGAVELDASIMEGTGRRAGAVGGLRRNRAAIRVARAVMERTPHALVAGEGADRLAEELGLPEESLLTEESERTWRDGIEGRLPAGSLGARMLSVMTHLATDPERAAGTVNFLSLDGHGHLASAVSTSGWAWKYPGRLGDSPVIGAGNYCDDRYGACACTGFGELAVRASTARTVVAGLASGLALEDACAAAMRDLFTLGGVPRAQLIMHLVALDPDGRACGMSTRPGTAYVVRADGDESFRRVDRIVVEPPAP